MTVFQKIRTGQLPDRLTVDDVYRLQAEGVIDEREHFELIEGEIVPMAAAKFSHHEAMKARLIEVLALSKPAEIGLFVASSISFSEDMLLEPDLALWPKGRESQKVRGPELLLVIEVATSSIAYDTRVKAALYASFGVRDYWVVDAVRETIRVHRHPDGGRYREVDEFEAGDVVRPLLLPDVAIRLSELA